VKELGVQLWSVRHLLERDYEGVLDGIVEFGYQAVEPAGYPGTTVEHAAAWYRSRGLTVPCVHSALPLGADEKRVLYEVEVLGCRKVIVSRGEQEFQTLDSVRHVCDELNEAAVTGAKEGIEIGYHNHWWEFADISEGGTSGFDILVENCDPAVFFELDTYWVLVGGADPVSVIRLLGERCRYLHVKDGPGTRGEPNVAVGRGVMDWPRVLTAAHYAGTAYVEFDRCEGDIMDALGESAENLKGVLHNLAGQANRGLPQGAQSELHT